MSLLNPKFHSCPAGEVIVVAGYVTVGWYECQGVRAYLAHSHKGKTEVWRVTVAGKKTHFRGAGAKGAADTRAYHAAMPIMTTEEIEKLL